jgi:ABC-type lipoprotein release transport system permease subunit
MPKKKKIDNAVMIKMVSDKTPQSEIMAKFGFKTSTQLKVAYANALMETGQAPVLKTGRSKKAKAIDPTVSVNKRGSLVISKNLAKHFGLSVGDAFDVRKSQAGLSLKLKANRLSVPKTGKK